MERFNLECDRSVTQAARRSEGSQGCREDTDNELNDGLPSFLFHDDSVLRVKHSRCKECARRRYSLVVLASVVVTLGEGL